MVSYQINLSLKGINWFGCSYIATTGINFSTIAFHLQSRITFRTEQKAIWKPVPEIEESLCPSKAFAPFWFSSLQFKI